MNVGLAIDLCACILFTILTISHFRNKLWTTPDKIFFTILLSCTISAATSSLSSVLDGKTVPLWLLQMNSIIYFLARNATTYVYIFYIISVTVGWGAFYSRKKWLIAVSLPYILSVLVILSNPWTNWIFYYDNGIYHRNSLIFLLYATAAIYLFLSLLIVHKYRDMISAQKRLAFHAFFPISVLSVLIQMRFPDLTVEMFATAVCMILVMFTIQRAEEITDGTTGLWNQAAFAQDTRRYLYNNTPFIVVNIEISNLKILNETIGWMSVTEILSDVSRYLKQLRTDCSGLYAIGNGIFNITFTGRQIDKGEQIAKELNKRFCTTWPYHNLELNLLSHITVIHCPLDISDKDELMVFTHDFDKKEAPMGKVLHITDFDRQSMHRRKTLEGIINRALRENRFEVYYQPIYSVKERAFTSAEALIRLCDEEYGFIPPDEFIPVAEENMSILTIGTLVLETVCAFIASGKLKELGIQYIEVNLSIVQCMQADMASQILEIVNRHHIVPSQINLEVTETATLYAPETMLKNMEILKEHGIYFSLDDYGSGYANLSYLLNFPFSLIKLDRGIICTRDSDSQKWLALKHTIEMLLEMQYKIVAEGIETKAMADDVTAYGCHYLQGYYFSKAIPAGEFLEFIRQKNLPQP